MAQDWYTINNTEVLDTPALIVYPDRVLHNINEAKRMIGDIARLRPHVKTYKNLVVSSMLLQAGITKFKCATIAEAEMLAQCKAPDVLLAYQSFGPKINRLLQLIKNYPDTIFSCLVDNYTTAENIGQMATDNSIILNVYIDLNVGMDRTGIAPDADAMALYLKCLDIPGINPIGLHAYDGHIRDVDLAVRKQKSDSVFEQVDQLRQQLIKNGVEEPVVIMGGSPTFAINAKRETVESSPGTFIYWDQGYSQICAEQNFLPAALVVTRVISTPGPTFLSLDLGHKSIAAENPLDKRVSFLNAPGLKFIGQSEEHLVVDAGEDHPYKIGDVFYGLPYHICPTVALFERAITIENNTITGEWLNIARDRKINF